MEQEDIYVITFSPTHTSRRVADAVAHGMQGRSVKVIDLTCRRGEPLSLTIADGIAVVSVPVYAGRVAPLALKRLSAIRGNQTPVVLLAVYGNRDYEDALVELRDVLSAQGFVPLAAGAFIGEHSYSRPDYPIGANRPDKIDVACAENFGQRVADKWAGLNSLDALTPFFIKGNVPYREVGKPTPLAPVWNAESCVHCGTCMEACPTGAARCENACMTYDAALCMKCCACVKSCPVEALRFDTPYTAMLHAKFSARKEPELFV